MTYLNLKSCLDVGIKKGYLIIKILFFVNPAIFCDDTWSEWREKFFWLDDRGIRMKNKWRGFFKVGFGSINFG